MNKFNREHRRAQRERKIQYAFNVLWNTQCGNGCGFGERDDIYYYWKSIHDLILLETEEARRQHQESYRQKILSIAKLRAQHMCDCSCWTCGNAGYKKYEKTAQKRRTAEQDKWEFKNMEESTRIKLEAFYNP